MRQFIFSLVLATMPIGLLPAEAKAQLGYNALAQERLAQQQVVRWFQAYLGRLPNAQELAVLTNQYLLTGNGLYVQSILLGSNEFYQRAGGTPQGFLNRLFVTTLGRLPTYQEIAALQGQVYYNSRLWFVQAYLTNITGGWQLANWNRAVTAVPVPVVVPIIIR